MREKYGVKEIDFWDDLWGVNEQWVLRFCDLLIKENLDITWACETRVDRVNENVLKKMKEAGCWNIFYGFESGSQRLLDNVRKGVKLRQIKKAMLITRKAGIEVRGNFMLALPGETPELAQKTIDFAKELNPDYVRFNTLTVLPGTELFEHYKEYGKRESEYKKLHGYEPGFVPFGYRNKKEVEYIRKKAFKEFYIRPSYFMRRLMKIRTFEDIKRHIRGVSAVMAI